ncbi:hypothetical protein [Paraburkholderia sacchari]|uniref:hypothetical protein n=1 Tax=Paraburkholderia sacchari TaxID=159450 RepID=UPI001BD03F36|nr:hypothetical protein [Paraburkholderia sacchari]
MSNSTTLLDQISSTQANKEAVANALFDAASPGMLWGRHDSTTSLLTWGIYGGQYANNAVPNSTVTLTASTTNYVYADNATGAVSVNTTGVPAGKIPLYSIVTNATSATSWTDLRSYAPTSQVAGIGSQSANTVYAGPTSGAAAAPAFRALVPADLPLMGASGSGHQAGAVPDPGSTAGTTRYLREDGTWGNPVSGQPYDMAMFAPGVLVNSQKLTRVNMARAVTFPINLTGSYATAGAAATASTVLTITRNGTSIGTITFGAGATSGTFSFTSSVTTAAGDVIQVTGPATADATLGDVSITLVGTR